MRLQFHGLDSNWREISHRHVLEKEQISTSVGQAVPRTTWSSSSPRRASIPRGGKSDATQIEVFFGFEPPLGRRKRRLESRTRSSFLDSPGRGRRSGCR
jgi:hypothetical protein